VIGTPLTVFEHQGSYETQASAIAAIAPKIGCIAQTLSGWVRQAEKDSGLRDGITTEERDRIKALEREVRELRHPKAPRPPSRTGTAPRLLLLHRITKARKCRLLWHLTGSLQGDVQDYHITLKVGGFSDVP